MRFDRTKYHGRYPHRMAETGGTTGNAAGRGAEGSGRRRDRSNGVLSAQWRVRTSRAIRGVCQVGRGGAKRMNSIIKIFLAAWLGVVLFLAGLFFWQERYGDGSDVISFTMRPMHKSQGI